MKADPTGKAREKDVKMKKVINRAGTEVVYSSAEPLMEEDLREELHRKLAPCPEQEFFEAYEDAHEERFGEEWILSNESPQY